MKNRVLRVVLVVSLVGVAVVAAWQRLRPRGPGAATGAHLQAPPPSPTPPAPQAAPPAAGSRPFEGQAARASRPSPRAPGRADLGKAPAAPHAQELSLAAPLALPAEAPALAADDLGAPPRLGGAPSGGVEGGVPGRVMGGGVGGVVGGLPSASGRARHELQAERRPSHGEFHTEAYDRIQDNPFLAAAQSPLSTFSVDVDTASYANVRRFLVQRQLPPKDAVRIEELVNYFRYDYPEPRGETPFSVTTEVAPCPWRPEYRLVLIGLRGRSLEQHALPPRRLTFLLDVSGSMAPPDKLPLLKRAMALLVEGLREQDQIAIVVYAGRSELVLPPTSGDRQAEIRAALGSLEAGGSTAGGAGIELAYRVAAEMYEPGAINRVLLATDGDFNVGVTSAGELSRLVEEKRRSGVFLSLLGFGQGNLKDATMEMLADRGNGNYSYIDSVAEARKVLVSEAGATLVTIAKDVKIQVEWNPRRVAGYRLVGYENRMLRAEDFADDRKDAGEIGAGHTVTALYEVVPAGLPLERPGMEPLKYQQPPPLSPAARSGELMTVKLRYKEPAGEASRLVSTTVGPAQETAHGSERLRFAAAVAAFGMLLRESEHRGRADWPMVLELAREARGSDASGYRAEFLELAKRAAELSAPRHARGQVSR
jgi:Ca-activated chloride channel family protein